MKSNNNIQSFLTINDLKNHKVYEITNNINSKKYIGFTKQTAEDRFDGHCKSPYYIGNAIRKHGRENFTIKILAENLSQEEAGELEKHYIKELNTLANSGRGYNIAEGGYGNPWEGMSEERKVIASKNMSEAAKKARANRAPEEKAETIRKMKETKAKRTPEEKAIESKNKSEGAIKRHQNSTPEQKAIESKNKREAKLNMTPEEKVDAIRKQKETKANKTLKEKADAIRKQKETKANKTLKEKAITSKKQSEGIKKAYANMTPEQKTERGKNISEVIAYKYTQEETDFILQQKSLGLSIAKITKAFNEKFRKPSDYVGVKAIRNHIKRKKPF